jgi:hypothetical protein
MELRSFNVERIYRESVKCVIGEDLGVDKEQLNENAPHIKDMLSQILLLEGNKTLLRLCCVRKDGEKWTPYLQIVEMLIRMGAKLGYVQYEGKLNEYSVITINV